MRQQVVRHFSDPQVLKMSGRRDVIDIELRRHRKLKWMALPFTLPLIPDKARVTILNMVHAVRGRKGAAKRNLSFDFDESVIKIEPGLSPSLNLVVVATR